MRDPTIHLPYDGTHWCRDDAPSPLLTPAVVRKAANGVLNAGELSLLLICCRTQESRPCIPSEQHSIADLGSRGGDDLALALTIVYHKVV